MLLQSITIIILSLVVTQTSHTMDNNGAAGKKSRLKSIHDKTLVNKGSLSGSIIIDLSVYKQESPEKVAFHYRKSTHKIPNKISLCLLSSFIGLLSTFLSIHCILHHYSPYY